MRVDGPERTLGPVEVEGNLVARSGTDGIVLRIPVYGFPPGTEPPPLDGGPVVLAGNLSIADDGHGIVVEPGDLTRSSSSTAAPTERSPTRSTPRASGSSDADF